MSRLISSSVSIFALLVLCSLTTARAQEPQPSATPSIVYAIHDSAAIREYRTNPAVVRAMVDRLVIAATGQPDVAHAWRSLVSPDDKVGIKISAAGGELFTTHRDVVNAIADGLAASGVPRNRIIVWDRQLDGIRDAGYRPGAEGYQLIPITPREGYDGTTELKAAAIGKLIWGDLDYIPHKGANPISPEKENTSDISHFAKIVTQQVTKIINVPVMSDSFTTGIAGCLANMTLPNVDNWRRFAQFGKFGISGIAEIYSQSVIRNKVVLNIMDGLLAAYAGGPESHPNFAVHNGTLLASKDPVALDEIALKRLNQLRAAAKLPAIGELGSHVEMAGEAGLGNADPAQIELRNVGR